MSTPRATVRLQLHAGFTFRDAADTVDYYARLGISHFYVSPIFTARKGSTHGYDVIDPCSINPELGGDQGLRHLVDRLRAADMGLIIDIVPNHMGVAEGNRYWEDVLACGPASRYASWFDVDWDSPDPRLKGKLLLPVLGDAYQAVLQSGDLKLAFDAEEHRLFLMCYDKRLPLSQASTEDLLAGATGAAAKQLMEERLSRFDTRTPGGLEALHALLEAQHYRLSWWRNAAEEINWRRFFEVSDLAGVRVELEEVFEATHRLVFSLYGQGLIDGVRVDHVDGLADPAGYCRRLRSRLSQLQTQRPPGMTSGRAWIVVEKILSPGETLPLEWEVDGTTGYDFMDQAGKVLHDPRGEEALRNAWAEWTHDASSFEQQLSAARQQLLSENFVGELDALTHALVRHARTGALGGHDVAWSAVRRVLVALLTAFRRYRSYTTPEGTSALDQQVLEKALQEARRLVRPPDQALLTQVASWLVVQPATDGPTSESASAGATVLRAVTRFQQLTPPLAAKAMEDTVFYRYAPLLSRNEVGSFPGEVPGGLEAFHADNLRRASDYPLGMLTTATHDHKRGEDARARLAVLSEVPGVWEEKL
ncbi:MAG: treY, partial [Polaromonas sp.]|nr:treY [Polaromonas sp.]